MILTGSRIMAVEPLGIMNDDSLISFEIIHDNYHSPSFLIDLEKCHSKTVVSVEIVRRVPPI